MAIRPLSELAPYAISYDSMHVMEDVFFLSCPLVDPCVLLLH